jgi:hypothetical protein
MPTTMVTHCVSTVLQANTSSSREAGGTQIAFCVLLANFRGSPAVVQQPIALIAVLVPQMLTSIRPHLAHSVLPADMLPPVPLPVCFAPPAKRTSIVTQQHRAIAAIVAPFLQRVRLLASIVLVDLQTQTRPQALHALSAQQEHTLPVLRCLVIHASQAKPTLIWILLPPVRHVIQATLHQLRLSHARPARLGIMMMTRTQQLHVAGTTTFVMQDLTQSKHLHHALTVQLARPT